VTLPGSTTPSIVGQIGLTRFINKAGLKPIGDNLFTDTPASARHRTASPAPMGSATCSSPTSNSQCRSGLGNFRPDRGAARLRDERQGISAADQMLQSTSNLFR